MLSVLPPLGHPFKQLLTPWYSSFGCYSSWLWMVKYELVLSALSCSLCVQVASSEMRLLFFNWWDLHDMASWFSHHLHCHRGIGYFCWCQKHDWWKLAKKKSLWRSLWNKAQFPWLKFFYTGVVYVYKCFLNSAPVFIWKWVTENHNHAYMHILLLGLTTNCDIPPLTDSTSCQS